MYPETPGRSGTAAFLGTAKNVLALLLILATILCLVLGCSRAQQPTIPPPLPAQKKVLIVYVSRTGNTKAVAEFIRDTVGGTLFALETATPYPANYAAAVRQVARENETGYLPPLKTKVARIEQYDYVFLGFPTWGMQLPPPMKSFLRRYSLSGKTVIPFNTNAGYGAGSSFQTVRELCLDSRVLTGFSTRGGIERDGVLLVMKGSKAAETQNDIRAWLRTIGVSVRR